MRTAVCFAGAWREWPASWKHILQNIIEPLGDVDIFAVSDSSRAGAHGRGNPNFSVMQMRKLFGARFKDGEHLSVSHMSNVSRHTWPTIASVQDALPAQSSVFAYLYKIWRCGQLIHRSGVPYNVVIRLRPDLRPTQQFHIAVVPGTGGKGIVHELEVGGRCVRFGPRTVVIHAYTNYCANDWMAIGSLEAMTVTMDLLRFWSPASRFLSPDRGFDDLFSKSVEMAHNWLWWRTGTSVLRQPLFIELARRRCSRPSCMRMPAWQVIKEQVAASSELQGNKSICRVLPNTPVRPIVGTMQPGRNGLVNDCGAPNDNSTDLEWFTGPIQSSQSQGLVAASPLAAGGRVNRHTGTIEPPRMLRVSNSLSWERPACTNVQNLATADPLVPCKKVTGDDASYASAAHRPRVISGYGVPLCFNCHGLATIPTTSASGVASWAKLVRGAKSLNALMRAHHKVRAELDLLRVSSEAARASIGDTTRLRWNLRRCFSKKPLDNDKLPELRVLIVGCSMTQGFMNCGTTNEGKQCTIPCDRLAWYRVLGELLQSGLPGCKVVPLRSTSRGGRSVTTAQRFDTRVKRHSPNIIITDLTVCDLRGIASSLDEVRVQAGMEVLIRRTMSESTMPALLHMESWSEFNPMGSCKNRSAHHLHLPVAVHYNLPVTSFMLGICANDAEHALRRHWRGGCSPNASTCSALDTKGSDCEPHPGPHTHRIFALIMAEMILGEAVHLFGMQGMDDATTFLPPNPWNETQWVTLLPSAALVGLAACRAHHGTGNPMATLDFAEGDCGTPIRSEGWRCFSDRPGKPGWISEHHGDVAAEHTNLRTLSFEVSLPTTKLTIGYLRSYDVRMGSARLWLDDDIQEGIILNGSWASRTSQTDLSIVRTSQLCQQSCQKYKRGTKHKVHIQHMTGRKFKLLSVELC